MLKMNEKLVLDTLLCLERIYGGCLFSLNCRIRERYFEFLFLTKRGKFVEVRLVTSPVVVQRMINLMSQGDLRPDHLYLIINDTEEHLQKLIPDDIGLFILKGSDLQLMRKSKIREGTIPKGLFCKSVARTMVGLLNRLEEANHGKES